MTNEREKSLSRYLSEYGLTQTGIFVPVRKSLYRAFPGGAVAAGAVGSEYITDMANWSGNLAAFNLPAYNTLSSIFCGRLLISLVVSSALPATYGYRVGIDAPNIEAAGNATRYGDLIGGSNVINPLATDVPAVYDGNDDLTFSHVQYVFNNTGAVGATLFVNIQFEGIAALGIKSN